MDFFSEFDSRSVTLERTSFIQGHEFLWWHTAPFFQKAKHLLQSYNTHFKTTKMCFWWMKNGKAPGFKLSPNIKIARYMLLAHLVNLFNAIIDAKCYPQQFKWGATMTLFKCDKDKLDIIAIVTLLLYLSNRNSERIPNIDCRTTVLKYSSRSIHSKGVEHGVAA